MRIELDAVDVRVVLGDRLAELRQARERRVPMHRRGLLARGLDEGVDDVRRRRTSGLPRPRSISGSPGLGGHGCDAREQRREVLLGECFDPVGAGTHHPMLCVSDVAARIPHLGYVQSRDGGYPGRAMFPAAHFCRCLPVMGALALQLVPPSGPDRFDWRNLG